MQHPHLQTNTQILMQADTLMKMHAQNLNEYTHKYNDKLTCTLNTYTHMLFCLYA